MVIRSIIFLVENKDDNKMSFLVASFFRSSWKYLMDCLTLKFRRKKGVVMSGMNPNLIVTSHTMYGTHNWRFNVQKVPMQEKFEKFLILEHCI